MPFDGNNSFLLTSNNNPNGILERLMMQKQRQPLLHVPVPMPSTPLRQLQPLPPAYYHADPNWLIQKVTAAKILQEQQEAHQKQNNDNSESAICAKFNFGMQRIRPELLIKSVTESKIAQKRQTARLEQEKRLAERVKQAKRTVGPLDFATLGEQTVLKLTDIMAALPATYEEQFRYGDLVKPVPISPKISANGGGGGQQRCYSKEEILTVGAQLEMAKFRAQQEAMKAAKKEAEEDGIGTPIRGQEN